MRVRDNGGDVVRRRHDVAGVRRKKGEKLLEEIRVPLQEHRVAMKEVRHGHFAAPKSKLDVLKVVPGALVVDEVKSDGREEQVGRRRADLHLAISLRHGPPDAGGDGGGYLREIGRVGGRRKKLGRSESDSVFLPLSLLCSAI